MSNPTRMNVRNSNTAKSSQTNITVALTDASQLLQVQTPSVVILTNGCHFKNTTLKPVAITASIMNFMPFNIGQRRRSDIPSNKPVSDWNRRIANHRWKQCVQLKARRGRSVVCFNSHAI